MSLHQEKAFEQEICDWLADHGWHYRDERPFDEGYDKATGLFLPDLYGWLYETQPEQLAKLLKRGGSAGTPAPVENILGEYAPVAKRLTDRIVKLLATDPLIGGGTLNVLKHPVDVTPARFSLFQPKPATDFNPELNARYAANRLRVMRQVHYSTKNDNSLDLVLFLNGIPVATIELKTELTQSLEKGLHQYAGYRKPIGEPLLEFGRGALVHFVITEEFVRMTTKLDSTNTKWLPFDRGRNNGAGNPPIEGTAPTAFFWQQILEHDTFLDMIGRFAHYSFPERKTPDGQTQIDRLLLFPRYHQWRSVTRLEAAALEEGPGHNYLVQHSAGSGKTNSIAWLAHRLFELHRSDGSKVFDGVIVVSDRRVLDGQLARAVESLQSKAGTFISISHEHGSKTPQLVDALTKGQAIIGVTLQTFPFALDALRDSPGLASRNYAVIADDAHSSQSGEASKKLREVLGTSAPVDGGEVDTEDFLAAIMAARAEGSHLSFFAFTATPKGKTLELFGRRDPVTGKPGPFDLYSMKQAIQEGFILDVLKNYLPYELAYELALKQGAADGEVDVIRANSTVMRWVRLHPYNIA